MVSGCMDLQRRPWRRQRWRGSWLRTGQKDDHRLSGLTHGCRQCSPRHRARPWSFPQTMVVGQGILAHITQLADAGADQVAQQTVNAPTFGQWCDGQLSGLHGPAWPPLSIPEITPVHPMERLIQRSSRCSLPGPLQRPSRRDGEASESYGSRGHGLVEQWRVDS